MSNNMNQYVEALEFDSLEKVELPKAFVQRTFTVTKRGELLVNKRFFESLCLEYESDFIDLRHDDNYRILMFRDGKEGDLPLLKKGKLIHREFSATLVSYGYELPVRYNFVKDCKRNLWIGYIDEVTPAPDITAMGEGRKPRRRKA